MITENLYLQVLDSEGSSYSIMSEIINHKSNGSAMAARLPRKGFNIQGKLTTKGWKLLISWKDGTTSWVLLKDLKEAYPVKVVAENTLANKILEEPAYAWWAWHVLKKHDRIIWKVKLRYWAQMHKYGIPLPKSIEEALWINRELGTNLWQKVIKKEMRTIDCAFEFPEDNKALVGYQKIDCHMVFDVKMTLKCKVQYVASGCQTEPTKDITFTSVVSWDNI